MATKTTDTEVVMVKPETTIICVFGDKDGSITKLLSLLHVEGKIPVHIRILHIDDGNLPIPPKEKMQDFHAHGEVKVTWPDVKSYQ